MPVDPETGKRIKRKSKQAQFRQVARERRVAELYLQGWTQKEIGADLGLSREAITKILAKLRERWMRQATTKVDERRIIELANIDRLEVLAQEGYDRSCRDTIKIVTREEQAMRDVAKDKKDKGKRTSKTNTGKNTETPLTTTPMPDYKLVPVRRVSERMVTGNPGNPAFLDRVAWCIEIRLKLFGILEQRGPEVNVTQVNWDGLNSRVVRSALDDPIEAKVREVEAQAEAARLLPPAPTPPHREERNGKH